jgi:hypothetical protein
MRRMRARVRARVDGDALVERDRIRIAESAAQIGLQTPPTAREVGPYAVTGIITEYSDEVEDFPSSAPCILEMISP